jgi:uncharacterized protein
MSDTQPLDLKSRREDILRVAARCGAHNVRFFGSRARGDEQVDSDLDVLISLETGKSLFDLIAFKQDLEDLLGINVDVVTEASLSRHIREDILSEAVAL